MQEGKVTDYYTSDGSPVSAQDLRALDPATQRDVMEAWFRARYEDPAERTPYNSEEGGYIWIYGGPFDASEELGAEFGEAVDQEVMDSLVEELNYECDSWAPTEQPGDYYDDFVDISDIADSYDNFGEALENVSELLHAPIENNVAPYLHRLLYVNIVTALETYLSDVFVKTVLSDGALVRKFVETTPDFKKRKFALSDVFAEIDRVEETVKGQLRQIVWHDLARVRLMYRDVLAVDVQTTKAIFRSVAIRHDLVHRNGKDKDGIGIPIKADDVVALAQEAHRLVRGIDEALSSTD